MGIYILLFILGLGAGLVLGWQITVCKIGNLVNVERTAHEATTKRFEGYREFIGNELKELHLENKQLREQLNSRQNQSL